MKANKRAALGFYSGRIVKCLEVPLLLYINSDNDIVLNKYYTFREWSFGDRYVGQRRSGNSAYRHKNPGYQYICTSMFITGGFISHKLGHKASAHQLENDWRHCGAAIPWIIMQPLTSKNYVHVADLGEAPKHAIIK